MATQIAMLHDVSKCCGCRACTVACKQWKDLPADKPVFTGDFQAPLSLTPVTYTLINMRNDEKNGKFNWLFAKFNCMHCGKPGCALSCPRAALEKLDNGVVTFYKEKCIGCGFCVTNCPYQVPRIDKEKNKSTKCNFCIDRLENNMIPACTKTCTSDAILFGKREDMEKIARARVEVLLRTYPNACLYNLDGTNLGVEGGAMVYVLTDKPSKFGFPENPSVSPSVAVWQDFANPAGKVLIGAAAVAVGTAFAINTIKSDKKDGGDHDAK